VVQYSAAEQQSARADNRSVGADAPGGTSQLCEQVVTVLQLAYISSDLE